MKKLIGPFKQLLPMNDLPRHGALKDSQLNIVDDGGVLLEDGKILKVAPYAELRKLSTPDTIHEEVPEDRVGLPGLIDCHTHMCWAGHRQRDYALRVCGTPYLEIAKQGGGILDTVQKTRLASPEQLLSDLQKRLKEHLYRGITCVEIKSGYGLNYEEELKILEVIQSAAKNTPQRLVSTCLAAHMKPKDFNGSNPDYLKGLVEKLLPEIQARKLSNRIDIFVEETAFSVEEGREYLNAAKAMGFDLTLHADQFTSGGAALGVELQAMSVDHLEATDNTDIKKIAKSNVIAVALPGASLGLGMRFTPARKLLDAGASLAISTDWNPGSAPMGDLVTKAAILGTFEHLSMAETFAAITIRAAAALKLQDQVGSLEVGKQADLLSYPCDDYRMILYKQGQIRPEQCWIQGEAQYV